MWKERGIECEGQIWRSEIFDCVTRSSNLEFKRTPAFGSFVFFLSLFLFFPFCVSLWRKWNEPLSFLSNFFSLQFLFFFFFCFLNFEFYENPTMKKMVFALLILHFKSPSNFSLYTLFLSRKRKWQRSDKIKNIDIVTFQFVKVIYSN